MPSKSIISLVALLFCSIAWPCRIAPQTLVRDHTALLKEAEVVVLAQAVEDQTLDPETCRFHILRTLKGMVHEEFVLPCQSLSHEKAQEEYTNHDDPSFWEKRMGRVMFGTNCQLMKPAFIATHQYLLILGVSPDTKQFEEINESTDKWLMFVDQHLQ
jgi:hypothetical protein